MNAASATGPQDASHPTEPRPLHTLGAIPGSWRSLPRALVHQVRASRQKVAMVDSTGASLTYAELLLRSVALGRVLARSTGKSPYVGVLLPSSVPAAVANIALSLWGRIAINLNFTTGQEVLDSSIRQAGITHVLTSRRALAKLEVKPSAELVYLEDLPRQVSKLDKVVAALAARVVPTPLLGTLLPGLRGESHEKVAAVIFTSGSTGDPKGVMLTHGNILSNVRQINEHLRLIDNEVLLGILPLFHSFGYTVTLWTVLCLGKTVAYHFNPKDARIVGNLCQEHGVTLVVASPTIMRSYVKRCDRDQFATVRLTVLGAEKLLPEVAAEIRDKLGIEPMEGYGCTETGPGIACNVIDEKRAWNGQMVPGHRPGTVGMPMPGTIVKTVDPDTGADLPRGARGLVFVKGPQIMKGYLGKPEITAGVLKNGWYNTGDVGFQDDDGFLSITGRLSRFSKIGGEMVPHELVEAAVLAASSRDDCQVVVTAVADPKRGERLVVLYDDLGQPISEIHRKLLASPLPRLWIPGPDDFQQVDSIPVLGTGKVDLQSVRRLAESRA